MLPTSSLKRANLLGCTKSGLASPFLFPPPLLPRPTVTQLHACSPSVISPPSPLPVPTKLCSVSSRLLSRLSISPYALGLLTSIIHTTCTFRLSFCGSNVVNHFFCDIPPLLKLSCTDTFLSELFMFLLSSVLGILSAVIILVSYVKIISAMLRMNSSQGRQKAFSTCSSHLMVVALFFGTAIFVYARPISSYSVQKDKVVSLIYTVVIPMLNPIIYSLRNKQVKVSVKDMFEERHSEAKMKISMFRPMQVGSPETLTDGSSENGNSSDHLLDPNSAGFLVETFLKSLKTQFAFKSGSIKY
ncbi:olfactory receptor 5G25-like [Pelobates fuscus]|uniref:olfactory receptor 5G25-like n=1 Tax=Pelobates fuscus TaxID=191477 RepID=UPI002FE4B50C